MNDKKSQFAGAKAAIFIAAICVAAAALTGCSAGRKNHASDEPAGSTLGGSLGSKKTTRSGSGVVVQYMEEQAELLTGLDRATVEPMGGELKVTWSSAALFDFDSAMLKPSSFDNVSKVAKVLLDYPDTYIVVSGHTDTEGEEDYNQKLSERRAISVRNFLEEKGVDSTRLETIGYGELRPVASNATEEGRRKNQRVEITIRPNETLLQRAAEKGK